MTLLQLLDHNRGSSTTSVADACQSILAWLQVVHHVTHDSGSRHPYRRRHNKGQVKTNFEQSRIYFLIFFPLLRIVDNVHLSNVPRKGQVIVLWFFWICSISPPPTKSVFILLTAAYPMGCPRDTAPPLTLTFEGSMSNILMFASTTTLKASLISNMAMSSIFRPAASRACQTQTVMF